MNSIPLYRDFGVAGELTHRPRGEPAPARRSLLRRVIDAIETSYRESGEVLSEETENDYTDTVACRPSRAAARAPSAFDRSCRRIGTRGPCRRRNCRRARDTEPP